MLIPLEGVLFAKKGRGVACGLDDGTKKGDRCPWGGPREALPTRLLGSLAGSPGDGEQLIGRFSVERRQEREGELREIKAGNQPSDGRGKG